MDSSEGGWLMGWVFLVLFVAALWAAVTDG